MELNLNQPAVLSFSGLSRAVTPTVYGLFKKKFEQMLKEDDALKELSNIVVFLDSPFKNSKNPTIKFSHPLQQLNDFELSLSVTSRLIMCWVLLNDFNEKVLLPALSEGKIVILLRYGLDAFLYSLLNCEDRVIMEAVEKAHGALIELRVKALEIPNLGVKMDAPYYLVPRGDAETITPESIKHIRLLRGRDVGQVRNLVSREQGLTNGYCRVEKGQHLAIYLDGTSAEEFANDALTKLLPSIKKFALAA